MDKIFSTVDWASGANVYEVNIRQYTPEGNFSAFSKHLPRLKAMGIEILWLMPITPISKKLRLGSLGSYYACSSYTDINPEFGNLADFKKLVAEAHALGFKLIIDWVANHTGWDHHWTTENPEWYLKDVKGNFTEQNGWTDVIDLDYGERGMRLAMIDAMQFWVRECDIDGFRCDMAHLVPLDFWKEARESCDALKPLFWLAECEVVNYHDVFDASYAWAWMQQTAKYTKDEATLSEIRELLHTYTQYPAGALKLFFTTNHDENSWNGTEFEKYRKAANAWAVFTCLWKGVPLVYSGQEIPNTKRLEFFNKDELLWDQPLQLESFYTKLLNLRKKNPAATEGETFILPSSHDNQLMAFMRKKDNDILLVLLNVSGEERVKVPVTHPWLSGMFKNLFSELVFSFNANESFELQAGEYFVYEKIG